MTRKKHIKLSEEDKISLCQLVEEEIVAHQNGDIDSLPYTQKLAEQYDVSDSTIAKTLRSLPPVLKEYRIVELRRECSKKGGKKSVELGVGVHGMSVEQRREPGKKNKKISADEELGLIQLVEGEVMAHQQGDSPNLTNNQQLADLYGYDHKSSILRILRDKLSPDVRQYREAVLRTEHGQNMQQKGLGYHGLNEEERMQARSRGGITSGTNSVRLNRGIHGLTTEQRIEFGKVSGKKGGLKAAETMRKTKGWGFNGIKYHSQQEATCGYLLEKYVPHFDIREGETFQINGDIEKSIDFLVNGVFVEWHPCTPYHGGRGDIPIHEEGQSFKRVTGNLEGAEKKEFVQDYGLVLAMNYLDERRQAVENSSYASTEVVLVQDPKQLYEFISRYNPDMPEQAEFVREFRNITKQVKKAA
ncbi:hypothetical protein CL618_01890 [archaeon]|nr:hypothetical protein [archaeon]|tara:strand:+ start:1256 stop:2503 length:1248 start_codon:yes stop_codon:yes gene_type:complete